MQVQNFVERAFVCAALASRSPPACASPPQLSGGYPLVGHSVEFIRSTIGLLDRARRELGEVAAFQVFNRRMVAMFGPEAHEAVFRAPDAILSPTEAYKIMTPVFGKDIVYDAPPEKMAEQLKMLLPALQGQAHAHVRRSGRPRDRADASQKWGEIGRRSISSTSAAC